MLKVYSFSLSIIVLILYIFEIVHSSSHTVEHEQNVGDKPLYPLRAYGILNTLNLLENDDDYRKIMEYATKFGRPYTKPRNELSNLSDDLDEIVQALDKNEMDSLPPFLATLLSNKRKEKSSRLMTPRLGRDVDDDIDCQRSRPPFAPRLGKKSLPFKPRLGRAYDDTKC